VFVRRQGQILLGRRRGVRGVGQWSTPGGHLVIGEEFEECARRETAEETGVEITNIHLATVTNDWLPDSGEHYVTVVMVADHLRGRARAMERKAFFRWGWFPWQDPPRPLSVYLRELCTRSFDPWGAFGPIQLPFPWALEEGRLSHAQEEATFQQPLEDTSVLDWLRDNGYGDTVAMIEQITEEWRAAGKTTRRNWWDVLAGDHLGRPRVVAGRAFPVLREARLRQGVLPLRDGR